MKDSVESIAGFLVGKSEHEFIAQETKTVRVRGPRLYCRKCRMPNQGNGTILLTEKTQKDHSLLLVLAKGEGCRTGVRVGKIISTPWDDPVHINRSPYHPEEYFIDECIAQLETEPLCQK